MTIFGALLSQIDEAAAIDDRDRYAVREVPRRPAYLVGRSTEGRPALLVRSSSSDVAMPLRLAGISARYAVPCSLTNEGEETVEHLSIVECSTSDAAQVSFFVACMDRVMAVLGARPTIAELASAVDRLVAMFQALASPPRREITGVAGELCFILLAHRPSMAVRAWHSDPFERYDFVAESLRVEVKASSGADRVHMLSADQACPPAGVTALLGSILVRQAAGGTTVGELVERIQRRLGRDHEAALMLQEGLVRLFGSTLEAAQAYSFDLENALESLLLFDLRSIPALRPPFPAEVSDVRFRVSLDDVPRADLGRLRGDLPPSASDILPAVGER